MNPNTLVLREYEAFRIGERWDAAARTISRHDAERIALFQSGSARRPIELGYQTGRATNWVGTLGLGRRVIEVVPKIDTSSGALSEARTRENLLQMIARAGIVPVTEADTARMSGSAGDPLLVAYLGLYVEKLTREWRRGAVKEYVSRSENRNFLRGKLLFQDQLRVNLVQHQRFFTACDEFIEDGPVSRLLKAALVCCLKQKMCALVSRNAKRLLQDFEGVSHVAFSSEALSRIQVNRQILRFEPLVHLARLILRNLSPRSSESGNNVFSLMFDMNEVFERFVAAELTSAIRETGVSVVSQVKGKSLLLKNGRRKFNLRPDIGVFSRGKAVCLLDTKWKRLDMSKPHANISQSDMYQMYAYGREFDSPVTVLLYPRFGSLPEKVAAYTHHPDRGADESDRMIIVRTIDLSSPISSLDVQRKMWRSLSEWVFSRNEII